jgi:hypothetical protein
LVSHVRGEIGRVVRDGFQLSSHLDCGLLTPPTISQRRRPRGRIVLPRRRKRRIPRLLVARRPRGPTISQPHGRIGTSSPAQVIARCPGCVVSQADRLTISVTLARVLAQSSGCIISLARDLPTSVVTGRVLAQSTGCVIGWALGLSLGSGLCGVGFGVLVGVGYAWFVETAGAALDGCGEGAECGQLFGVVAGHRPEVVQVERFFDVRPRAPWLPLSGLLRGTRGVGRVICHGRPVGRGSGVGAGGGVDGVGGCSRSSRVSSVGS